MKQEIWHGDCLELIKNIEDKSIDLILTDPPYGVSAQLWDKIIPFDLLWKEFQRIGKENCVYAVFGAQPFTTQLINSNLKSFKYCWYWVKNQSTNFLHAKRMPLRKIEEICIFGGSKYYPQFTEGHTPTNSAYGSSKGKVYHGENKREYRGGETRRYPSNLLEFKCVDNYSRKHPNQKPVDLLEYLIKTYSLKGDLILDCFSGSGSTLAAAKNLDRQFIGIEKEKEYYNICVDRLSKK